MTQNCSQRPTQLALAQACYAEETILADANKSFYPYNNNWEPERQEESKLQSVHMLSSLDSQRKAEIEERYKQQFREMHQSN